MFISSTYHNLVKSTPSFRGICTNPLKVSSSDIHNQKRRHPHVDSEQPTDSHLQDLSQIPCRQLLPGKEAELFCKQRGTLLGQGTLLNMLTKEAFLDWGLRVKCWRVLGPPPVWKVGLSSTGTSNGGCCSGEGLTAVNHSVMWSRVTDTGQEPQRGQ